MFDLLRNMNRFAGRHAGGVLIVGLAGVAWYNWRLWRKDSLLVNARTSTLSQPVFGEWPDQPKVSVLVAAWNEAEHVGNHIRSFLEVDYPNKELVLCAGGRDNTYALAVKLAGPQVKVLRQHPGEGKQRGLQRCLFRSDGEIIYLSDADCEFSASAFLRLIEPLALGQASVVTGVSGPKEGQSLNTLVQYQWLNDVLWSHKLPPMVDGVLGRNCALLRDVLEDVGAFHRSVCTGTDYFLSKLLVRAGYEIRAVPESRIATEYPDSPRDYLRMWRRWNKNLLVHGLQFGAWRDIKGVAAASALYGVMLSMPVLAPIVGPIALVISVLLFSMASANRWRRLTAGARLAGAKMSWRFLALIPFYTLLDMLAVLLAVRDAVDPRLRSKW